MSERVLVLSPHTDDGELGSGGSISRFVSEGREVFYAVFSTCEKSVPKGQPKDILKHEVKKATAVLGIKPKNLLMYDYPVREFPSHRQEILDALICLRKDIAPDLVFMPSTMDTHQDHQTISQEALRAFKMSSTLLGYEQPWNHITFSTTSFIRLDESQLKNKINALSCYKSQADRVYFKEDFIRSLARVRGSQISSEFAEAFEVVRWIL